MSAVPHLDLRGSTSPEPVLKTKAFLDGLPLGSLTVALDNEAAAVDVAAFLNNMALMTQTFRRGEEWLVLGRPSLDSNILVWHTEQGWQTAWDRDGLLVRGADEEIIDLPPPFTPLSDSGGDPIDLGPALFGPSGPPPAAEDQPGEDQGPDTVVFVGSDTMGRGDPELGRKLLSSFFETLAAVGPPPRLIFFYNTGVMLTTGEPPLLETLKSLEQQGSQIVSCGICLEYFQLKNSLRVGRAGGMHEIINAQKSADRILRP